MSPRTAIASLVIATAMTLGAMLVIFLYATMWLLAQLLRWLLWPFRALRKR